jgi:long-chain acyl-CoA synthetase
LSILPSWHAYERATEYYGLSHGTTLTYSDKKYIREDLLKLCPHLLPCVPRIWESVYKAIHAKLSSAPEKRQKLFHIFTEAALRYVQARRIAFGKYPSVKPVTAFKMLTAWIEMAFLYPVYKLGDRMVFSKLRQITGGRLKAAVSGGGSFPPYLDDFFEAVGIPILNGYGLTETSPVVTVRTLDNNVRGTVGRAMAETEISIRTETGEILEPGHVGEIWAKGPQIMTGYYKNPEATQKVLKDDGWFITGDLGWITPHGDLVITGRLKDTIVLSSGENVEPELIEDACRKSPFVQQILLVGQDQKTLGALVVPDYPHLAEALGLSAESSHEEIAGREDAAKLVRLSLAQVMAADGGFKAAESISKIKLLAEPFSEANGMMTNTLKIKRNVVNEKYRDVISEMYR